MPQSKNTERYTPQVAIDFVLEVFGEYGITLDPFADPNKRIPALFHLRKEDDGLKNHWEFGVFPCNVFVNPPFNAIPECARKGNEELVQTPGMSQLWLIPNKQGTRGFRLLTRDSGQPYAIAIPKGGRYTFLQGDETGRILEPGEIGPNGKPYKPDPVMFDMAWVFKTYHIGAMERFIAVADKAGMLVLRGTK